MDPMPDSEHIASKFISFLVAFTVSNHRFISKNTVGGIIMKFLLSASFETLSMMDWFGLNPLL